MVLYVFTSFENLSRPLLTPGSTPRVRQHRPAVSSHERPGRQRSQQPSDAEDGDGEGPDERNLPLIQMQVISLQAREVHQLLDVLHKPRIS